MIKFLKQKNSKKNKTGFTLIETLVAISIFSVSILGMMAVLYNGTTNINFLKKKMVATYLAQEGIEYVRNMRDSFVISQSDGWNNFNDKLSTGLCDQTNGCYYMNQELGIGNLITSTVIKKCEDNQCRPNLLHYNPGTSGYDYFSSNLTDFSRKITYEKINDEVKITSTVYWQQGSGMQSVSFSENLFNWIQ